MSKILFSEHNILATTPGLLQQTGHEVWVVKEDIPGVHEFGREEFLNLVKEFQPDVLVCGFKFQVDKTVLDNVDRAVFTRTTGLDHISLDYAKEKGIEVIPLYGSELGDIVAVPELCLWAMLELMRRRGKQELKGKTLGLIGYGRISKLVEKRAKAFEANVLKYDINLSEASNQSNAGLLEVVLQTSDIVSLHISSVEENRNFMDRAKFEQMKDGSYFLNSSRGWLVDESALMWALESGKLAGAWSDFPVSFEHPNLIVTNHQGGKTIESASKTETILVNKLLQWLQSSPSAAKTT